MSDVITVKGAKAGQDKARKPSIAKDSVASTSTAKLLYGLAEGEVYGLVDGGKSIRLDGTPLLDDNSSSNFDGVTWDFRHGTNEQEYIQGFPDVSNETGINVELKSSQPFIKAFTDTQLDAIRVRFKWNRLSKTDDEDGDVTGYKIDYAIDLQTDGGAYQNVLTTKIEDKTSAGYERTHRIDLPKATSGWQIRVRRITENSDSEYIQDEMYIDAVAEVIDVKLAYPNTALLGIQYNAETFSSIAKIAVHMRGSIIRVPSNYDATARTYTGIWDGTFKDAYSNNPAWVYYDLCMQWRYGLGDRLDATMIDKWSLYTLGQYCDEQVSDGQGGLEPRYTCNVYLQKQADAYQVLQNIAGLFAALSYWNGEKIFVDADVPKDPVYTFSRANVIGGQFEYTGTRARDRHTIVKVAWDNPANNFETEYEYVRDDKAIAKFGVKVLDLAAFGCTSQGQAQRMGLRALKTEQLETRQVSFSVGLDGVNCGIGNIINVSDELFAGRANGGRVSTVNSTQRIITLDREVVASAGDVLIINGGNGKSERRNISNVVGNRITVTASFTSAESEHVWAIETADLKLMRFRVMQITENSDDNTYNIVGIQHEPQKYDAIDFGTDVKPTNITIVNPQTVDAPSAVTITSRHRVVQSQTIATLVIGWSQVKDAVSYDVEWRKDDGTWIKIPRTGNVSVEIDGVYSGNYLARVRAISPFDVQSQPTTSLLTAIEGKIGLPPVILGLVGTGVLFGIELKWGFGAGSGDSDYTEIQTGSAPNTNVALLGQFSYPTNSHVITGLQGNLSQSYRARLVDKLGNKSEWSAWATATTDASADKVLDLVQGKINESSLNTALTTKIAKIGTLETGLDTETQNRIDAIIDANSKINTERDARIADVLAASNAVAVNAGAIVSEQQARIADVLNANNKISVEQQARIAGLLVANNAIIAETQNRIDAIVDANSKINTERDARIADLLATNEGVTTETMQRKAADTALGQRIDTVITKSGTNTSAIQTEVTARTNADSALSTRIDTVVSKSNSNTAAITSEVTARTSADSALSTRIDTVSSKTDTNTATITTVNNTLTNSLGSQAEQINAIKADYQPEYFDKTKYFSSQAQQWTYAKTVARDNYAESQRITNLQAEVSDSNATVTQNLNTLATTDEALANSITALNATTDRNTAGIASETTARTNADSALSQRVDTTLAKTNDNAAAIIAEQTTRTNADSALSTRIDTVTATSGGNKSAIQAETKSRADADTALGSRIDTITASSGDNKSAIQAEVIARTDADAALGSRIDTVVTTVGNNKASITSETTARTNADSALGLRIDTVSAKTGDNTAAIASETTARTNADSAITTNITSMGVKVGDNTSAISSESMARTNADSALSTRIDTITAESGSNKTAIQTEILARTTADTALGQRIDTVATKSAGNTAAITSEVTARTSADSALSTRIDTVSSKTDTNTATITTVNNTLTNSLGSQAEQINAIKADYQPDYFDKTKYFSSQAQQWTYAKSVARDNYAESQRITNLQAEVSDSNALFNNELLTLAETDQALVTDVTTLKADTANNNALIINESQTRTTQFGSLSQQVNTVQSQTTAAQSTANQAVTDAQVKANQAKLDAIAAANLYADAQAKAKADAAIALASGDATDKANAAKSAALAGAALDAKAKADAAQLAATQVANAAQATATEALGKVNTATANIAIIKTDLQAVTTQSSATASSVATLQTTVGTNTASIQTAQSSINGINLQYTVKLDSGGKISGFGLMNDGVTSAFDVRADRFSISAPVGKPNDVAGTSPFMVLTNPQVIDGVTVPAGVYARNFYAPKASIDTIQVKDAAIKSSQIDDLAVTTGKIADLAVDTLQIAGNAVTVPILRYIPIIPRIEHPQAQDQYTKIAEATLGTTEGMVAVVVGIDYIKGFQAQTGIDLRVELRAGNDILRTWKGWGATSRPTIDGNTYLVTELEYITFPTVSGIIGPNVVYSLWVRVLGNSNPWPKKAYIETKGVTLQLTGVKK